MGWIVVAALAFVLTGGVVYLIGIYNGLVRLKHGIDQAWANIDVLLKQRHDELPKLIDTVKGYMAHEREVLEGIAKARSSFERARTVEEKGEADGAVRSALGRLFAVAERYPELKADSSFRMLEERISTLEENLADRREYFNYAVYTFNVRIEQLPDVFLAHAMQLTPHTLFRAREEDRKNVRVSFA